MSNKSNWSLSTKKLPLAFEWKIARGSVHEKENLFLTFSEGDFSVTAECAPNIRYGESVDLLLSDFKDGESSYFCLKSAIEYCKLSYEAHKKQVSLAELMGGETIKSLKSSYSIPIMEPRELSNYLKTFGDDFPFYKMKVSGFDSLGLIHEFYKLKPKTPILLDGNEGFRSAEEVIKLLAEISHYPVEFIEQPLSAHNLSEQEKLYLSSPLPIFADESCLNETKIDDLKGVFHGINVKLMKSSPKVAHNQLRRAKELGMKTMVGCMVETSLGISQVMNLGLVADYYDLDGWLFFKDEPFGLLEKHLGVFNLR